MTAVSRSAAARQSAAARGIDGVMVASTLGADPLTRELADWIAHTDWAEAEAYHRAHEAALRTGAIRDELRAVVADHPGDRRLHAFLTVLSAAGGLPAAGAPRLTPAATSFLAVEPPWDAARGPMPATVVYDYLRSAGAARRDRYALDGLLFQLMVAGQLDPADTVALARAAAVHRVDHANARVYEVLADLFRVPDAELLADPAAVTNRFTELVRPIAGRAPGGSPEDCLDPVDRTAWVGRLDAHRNRLRALGDAAEAHRAEVLDAITYTLSNC